MNALNVDTAETAKAEGIWLNGHYINPGEYRACLRCGRIRQVRRNAADICVDCKTVERHAARTIAEPLAGRIRVKRPGGIIRFEPLPEPLTDEDRAWCRAQEERHFWATWERTNRAGTTTEATIQQAIRKVG